MVTHERRSRMRLKTCIRLVFATVLGLAPMAAGAPPTVAVKQPANGTGAPPGQVRVAGIVLKWLRTDKEANYSRAEALIERAARGGAQIVCTTECFLDGYAIKDKTIRLDEYRALGEPIPNGPFYRRLAKLADRLDLWLVAGMLEADGEERYNTAVLIDAEGELAGRYRKHKLEHELVQNTPGNQTPTFDTPFGRIGILICADHRDGDRLSVRGAFVGLETCCGF